ncbi:MAG TPA: Gfo/Idh/MocA family oxidoreductase [Planctomycetota bacterium]
MMAEADVQFVAVCDIRKAQRENLKKTIDAKYGTKDCATYGDIRQFLAERTDVDAVLIATGDRWHATAATMAMKAGKDVYCEKPSCLTIAEGQQVVETAKRYGRVYQTGAQRLSEPNHIFAIEMARTGRLGKLQTLYADCRYRGGSRRDWLPAMAEPPAEEVNWDAWLGPCQWRPYNKGYLQSGWYNFYDFATDMAMWGAHTVAQALAPIDLSTISHIELEYGGPNTAMMTRLSNGLPMVLFREPGGDCWKPCKYWHSSCGERFDGTEGWAGAADGYSKPDVSSPKLYAEFKKVLAEYVARTQRPMSHVRDFFDCVKSRRKTVATPEVMYTSMAICLAADICDILKRNLKLDLVKGEFVNDPEANKFRSRPVRAPWKA